MISKDLKLTKMIQFIKCCKEIYVFIPACLLGKKTQEVMNEFQCFQAILILLFSNATHV